MAIATTLIIAEKPSVARELAAWLSRTQGLRAVPRGRSHIEVGPYTISWLFGHVLENVEPHEYEVRYKRWTMTDLPIIPDAWKLRPRADRKSGKADAGVLAQIKTLKALLGEVKEVIGLGDPDQEGQLLQDEFLLWAGNRKPVKRLWLSAMDDKEVEKAWKAMKPNSAYAGYYWSALARSHADWLIGINLTRACTLASQANGGNAVLSIGRVQTPTLSLVVAREKEIRAFKPVDYYTPFIELATAPAFKAAWAPDKEKDDRLDAEGRLLDRKTADAIAAACKKAGKASVVSVASKKGKEAPPLPFALSTLQSHMSWRFGMSVNDTLKHAQALYEKKIASYPRTDAEYLPEAQFADAPSLLDGMRRMGLAQLDAALAKADMSLKSAAFNDKMVTAHYAIVPRPATFAQISALSAPEKTLWLEIAKRYLLQFFPGAEFTNTEIVLACASETFKAKGKVYSVRGWKDAFAEGVEEEDEAEKGGGALPAVRKGDTLPVGTAGVQSTRTKPPKRFTDGTLIKAMKAIHRYVDDPALRATLRENEGIGTEATRARIIEELFRRRFLVLDKKEVKPTALGEQLYDALPHQLRVPDMAARWQQVMSDIRASASAEAGYKAFRAEQEKWLRGNLPEVPAWFRGRSLVDHSKSTAGPVRTVAAPKKALPSVTAGGVSSGDVCPKCGKGNMVTRACGPMSKSPGRLFLACSNNFASGAEQCKHAIWPPRAI